MKRNQKYIYLLLVAILTACSSDNTKPETVFNESVVISEVEEAVWKFHKADTLKSPDMVIDLLWPDCSFLIDGQRLGFEDIENGSKAFMNSIKEFHTNWNDLEIIPIGPNAALASFIFQDSIIDNSGKITRSHGPNTFLWIKRDDEWRLRFVDADHYQFGQDE